MTEDLYFPLEPVYDKITGDTDVFDYPEIAEAVVEAVGTEASVLELCVGTGLLALEVQRLGPRVTGLDLSSKMLAKAVRRFLEAGKDPDFIHASAIDFSLDRTFDAIYVYSGHILLNRRDRRLFTNGIMVQELRTALKSAHGHLVPGGQILLGIEKWESEGKCEFFPTHDGSGSWYQRWIIEENDHFGTRLHVFFDKPSSKIYVEESEGRPKLSRERLLATLEEVGFIEPTESTHFLIARRV